MNHVQNSTYDLTKVQNYPMSTIKGSKNGPAHSTNKNIWPLCLLLTKRAFCIWAWCHHCTQSAALWSMVSLWASLNVDCSTAQMLHNLPIIHTIKRWDNRDEPILRGHAWYQWSCILNYIPRRWTNWWPRSSPECVSWSEEPTKKTEETGDQVCMYQEEQRHTPLGTTLTSGKLQRMPHATMNRSATTWPALANSRFL